MWEKFTAVASSLIQVSSLLVKNQKEIDEMQEQIAEIQKNVELMARDIAHFTEMERAHHRNNLLELENRILQMERRLPPTNEQKAG